MWPLQWVNCCKSYHLRDEGRFGIVCRGAFCIRDIMTNRIAVYLGLFIVALIVLDITMNEGDRVIFLMKKFWDLIEYSAFWR